MRNFKILCLLTVVSCMICFESSSQNLPPFEIKELGKVQQLQTDDNGGGLVCGPDYLYGQPVEQANPIAAPSLLLPGENGYMVVDNYFNVNSAVAGITFWAVFQTEGFCLPTQPISFRICFYESDIENPNYEYDLSLTGELIDLGSIPIFRFEGTFPEPANLPEAGLVSIQHIVDPFQPPCLFYWISSSEGDMSSLVLFIENGEIVDGQAIPLDWSFCLYQTRVIPIANWAVMVGFILILVTLFIRLRKHY